MILVDSSVWIDYFRASITPQTDMLHALLAHKVVAVADLMVVEVLQGTGSDLDFAAILQLLERVTLVTISNHDIAVLAARNYRALRTKGIPFAKRLIHSLPHGASSMISLCSIRIAIFSPLLIIWACVMRWVRLCFRGDGSITQPAIAPTESAQTILTACRASDTKDH